MVSYKVGPLPVINGGTGGPCKWPYNWVTGVITPINGVRTPLITSRGPPCIAI